MRTVLSNLNNMENNLYEVMLNDQGFLNDLWHEFDATTKFSVLAQAGCNMVKEYEDYMKRNNEQLPL